MKKIKEYITEDLGYCCLWAFFTMYKRTAIIADRLGVSDRAIRKHKAEFRCGNYKCECKEKCMKDAIKELMK